MTQNKATGIRNYNMSANPLTYSNVGYDFSGPEVHSDGEIWDGTNFLIRQKFLAKYPARANAAVTQQACANGRIQRGGVPWQPSLDSERLRCFLADATGREHAGCS